MDWDVDGSIDRELFARALAEVMPPFNDLYQAHQDVAIDIAQDYYRLLAPALQVRVMHRYRGLIPRTYRRIEDL